MSAPASRVQEGDAVATGLLAAALHAPLSGRLAVLHLDDLGMCHGANGAFLELARSGAVTCGAVMAPCPWFAEIAAAGAADPSLDLGIHLTLTSEWPRYRWGPVAPVGRHSGLVDADGYFPRDLATLRRTLVPEAAEAEFRAQIERVHRAGIRPTHLDTHMGAALLPELAGIYVRLGREYHLPVLMPRRGADLAMLVGDVAPDAAVHAAQLLTAAGSQFDAVWTIPWRGPGQTAASCRAVLHALSPGVTYLILHCTMPGDIGAIAPDGGAGRIAEYRLFRSGRPTAWLRKEGITPIGMRAVQAALYPA